MENKQLQIAKDTIAKERNFKDWNDLNKGKIRDYNEEYIDQIATEYHRLMSECDVDEEKEEQPILIGYLNKEFGYQNHLPIQIGTEVFLHKDRYFFYTTTLSGLRQMVQFYKETLHNAIDFI